ncbi:MAG: copper ion binding protein [Verrucomicrobia bacterium]|nr:copper ion binding protein [Verrucomicrobiota bacterium]
MKSTKTLLTLAVIGSGLATAGLVLTGNDLGGACPVDKASAGACCPVSGSCDIAKDACPVDLTLKKATAAYQVSGMSCGACETKLTQALGKVAGVGESSACAKTGLTKVSYDPTAVKKDQLVAAIKAAGYKLDGEVVELKVAGLDCTACTGTVSKALTSVEGVKAQKVCAESKVAMVTFDPAKTSRETIVAAIDKSGFKVTP